MADPPFPGPADRISIELDAQLTKSAERVRRVATRHGLGESEVDEVFQEVRIRLWRALKQGGKIAEAPASYVYRTAVSAAIDLIRRRRARREDRTDLDQPNAEATFGSAPPADHAVEENELADLVEHEIARLPADRGLVVRMHLNGYPREEIASMLRWSEPRTRHLLYRGLAQLRALLLARGIGPEVRE